MAKEATPSAAVGAAVVVVVMVVVDVAWLRTSVVVVLSDFSLRSWWIHPKKFLAVNKRTTTVHQ